MPSRDCPISTRFAPTAAARDRPLIVTRVHNYAEIASTLPPEDERRFVEQIVSRLSVGSTCAHDLPGR